MALDATKIVKIAGADNSLFLYTTADAIATVTASGYFDGVAGNLKQYDIIVVTSSTGGVVAVDVLVVTSATFATTVTTTNGT